MSNFNSDGKTLSSSMQKTYHQAGENQKAFDKELFVARGVDVDAHHFKTTPSAVAQHLFGMASYALNCEPLLKNNDTIGIDGMQQFRVRKGPHAPGRSPNRVMAVEKVQ